MTHQTSTTSVATRFAVSVLLGFAIPALGFRIMYDGVIPEVLAWVLSGLVLTLAAPRLWWLWVIGLDVGIVLSNLVPATPPAGHVAKYGPPPGFSFGGALILFGFPLLGAATALLVRAIEWMARQIGNWRDRAPAARPE
jgi:hypothetical protein